MLSTITMITKQDLINIVYPLTYLTWMVKWRNPSRCDDGRIQVRQVARHIVFGVISNCASVNSLQLQHTWKHDCRNLSLGLMTKARACKSVRQEGGLGGTSYTPESAGERERMNLHTPKWTPTWGVRVMMDSQIFKEWLQGSKPIGWKNYFYHWKAIET
jgi:hypothetical protein